MSKRNGRMVWFCEICEKRIYDGHGRITLMERVPDPEPAHLVAARENGWAVPVQVLTEYNPSSVLIHIWHNRCATKSGYDIAIERCRTFGQFSGWCAHLSEKGWINHDGLRELLHLIYQQPADTHAN